MKVSIITATYNSERNIHDCLQSVTKQSHKNIEHIIIDGASTDNTLEFVKNSPSVSQWISEPDHGIYDALNKGIKLATGDVIGFLHSDDMLGSNDTVQKIADSFFSQTTQNSASFPHKIKHSLYFPLRGNGQHKACGWPDREVGAR